MNCRETDRYTQGQECFVRIIPAPVIYPSVLSRFLPHSQDCQIALKTSKYSTLPPYRKDGIISVKSEAEGTADEDTV